jgi:hypothetical protein
MQHIDYLHKRIILSAANGWLLQRKISYTFLAEKIGISLNVLIPNSLSKNFEG